jgi:hypothetical protein
MTKSFRNGKWNTGCQATGMEGQQEWVCERVTGRTRVGVEEVVRNAVVEVDV